MARWSETTFYRSVLSCDFFLFIFVSVEDEQKNNSVIWRDVGQVWLVAYERRKSSMSVCRWEWSSEKG